MTPTTHVPVRLTQHRLLMTHEDTYRSLTTTSEGFYREKGSKFYAHAYGVASEAEITERLKELRARYHDARHHCYAFVLKPREGQEERFRANDDGEPPHSAGDPILGQLRSLDICDALVVVVRYFGGTKLGVGGLINAYKTAAGAALAHNRIVQKTRKGSLSIRFTYPATSEVQQAIHHGQAEIVEQDFGQDCYYRLQVPYSQLKIIEQQFAIIPGVVVLP